MNEKVAFVQNGRDVPWNEVTVDDLRATMMNYPSTEAARYSRIEWLRRTGKAFWY